MHHIMLHCTILQHNNMALWKASLDDLAAWISSPLPAPRGALCGALEGGGRGELDCLWHCMSSPLSAPRGGCVKAGGGQ